MFFVSYLTNKLPKIPYIEKIRMCMCVLPQCMIRSGKKMYSKPSKGCKGSTSVMTYWLVWMDRVNLRPNHAIPIPSILALCDITNT